MTYRGWLRVGDDQRPPVGSVARTHPSAPRPPSWKQKQAELADRLRLLPTDANDRKDVILDVQAGAGGDQSALFAGDLPRVYLRYVEQQGWRTEILDATEETLAATNPSPSPSWAGTTPSPGVGRSTSAASIASIAQRMPVTEAPCGLHTSAVGVLVLPEAEAVEVQIDPMTCELMFTGRRGGWREDQHD